METLFVVAGAEGTTVQSALQTAFTSGASEMTSMITTIAPIAVGVVVAGLVCMFGIKFFKRIAGKA